MEAHQDEHSIVKMCSVLQVSTSGFYKWKAKLRSGKTEREKQKADLKKKISQSFHASLATYGSPRVHQDLIAWGYMVSQKTVARYMQEMKVSAKPKVKYVVTTDSTHALHVYPNLLKRVFQAAYPNAIWVADITYVRTLEGWLYVASIMDLFSRKIVGLNMSTSMEKDLVLHALERAIVTRRPPEGLIHHSDRGSQYCSNEYIEALTQAKATISMSRKGDPYDNACIESFHATIKRELIYRFRFQTRNEAMKAIHHYIYSRYNETRRHSTLNYQSPNQFEKTYAQRINHDSQKTIS